MSTENAVYAALHAGPMSRAELAKKTKLSDEELDAAISEFRSRMWLTSDDSGKTEKFSLTEEGARQLGERYP